MFYKFVYVNQNNQKIRNQSIIDRINKLRIPPGYKDVLISNNTKSDIQAIGYDDKGRRQYIYNDKFLEKNQEKKYNDIIKLGKHINRIENDITRYISQIYRKPYNKWVQPTTNIMIVLYLLSKCNFRIGNIKYANKYGSYGSTTLKNKHIKLNSNNLTIEFIGKKGVFNKGEIKDPKMTRIFRELKNKKSNFIFTYKNGTGEHLITAEHINDYLTKYDSDIVPKMFRTWYGNVYFIDKIRRDIKSGNNDLNDVQKGEKYNKYMKSCCQYVADKLHNTPGISKKSYMDHLLLESFINNPKKFVKNISQNNKLNSNQILLKLLSKLRKN